jgi:clan AA aspartic protease
MMRGRVNSRLEAILHLSVFGPTGLQRGIEALIDTGCTSSLVLPVDMIAALGLIRRSGGTALLADGSIRHFDTYGAEVEWNGMRKGVVVSAIGNEALVGMMLLADQRLVVDVIDGGQVEIQQLRP